MPRKAPPAQPPLFSKRTIAPIKADDALAFADLQTFTYSCDCGNVTETRTPLPAVRCARCGGTMQPNFEDSTARERKNHE